MGVEVAVLVFGWGCALCSVLVMLSDALHQEGSEDDEP